MRMYNMSSGMSFPTESALVINSASPLVSKLESMVESDAESAKSIASYIYKVSLLSQKKFSSEEMQEFMKDSFELLMKL